MNNLKKIGLSALAGSLVAVSANAGELSVSGTAEFTYTDSNGSTGSGNNITGNPYAANNNISFTGSGDVGFGELTVVRVLNDSGDSLDTAYATLDMGDLGTISFDSEDGGLVGLSASDDLTPTAYEEVWTGTSSSYVGGGTSTNALGYANTIGPVSFSAGYQKGADGTNDTQGESSSSGAGITGSTTSYYASVDMGAIGIDGLTIGAGAAEVTQNSSTTADADSKYIGGNINYSIGNVSIGYRQSEANGGATDEASTSTTGFGIAFNVNENFAISYGEQTTEQDDVTSTTNNIDEEVTGINASYTMGAASIRFLNSVSDNDGFVSAVEKEHTELSLVLSF